MHLIDTITELPGLTHMPFRTESHLFFCAPAGETETGSKIWKIHFLDPQGRLHRLRTRTEPAAMECSPTAWLDKLGWHVSFVSGGLPENPRFHIFFMEGSCLFGLGAPIAMQASRTGFVYKDRIVWGRPNDLVHINEGPVSRTLTLPGTQLYRISYRSDNPDVLLITVKVELEERFAVVEYNLRSRVQVELECDGEPAYKCSVFKNEVWFAHRGDRDFEDRQVRRAKLVERLPTQLIESDEVVEE